jgi:hypothetical protein
MAHISSRNSSGDRPRDDPDHTLAGIVKSVRPQASQTSASVGTCIMTGGGGGAAACVEPPQQAQGGSRVASNAATIRSLHGAAQKAQLG